MKGTLWTIMGAGCLGLAVTYAQIQNTPMLKRLDPHGVESQPITKLTHFTGHSECTVCHQIKNGQFETKPKVGESCRECHGVAPHSGVAEHVGKTFKGQPISCLTCHSPHRSEGNNFDLQGAFSKRIAGPRISGELKISNAGHPMLKISCLECHTWKN